MKPTLSLIISSAALTFQVAVLYPWHTEISRQIAELAGPRHIEDWSPTCGEKSK